MARPRTFEAGQRIHVGIRYEKAFIALFDRVAKGQGLTRNQAVDWCLRSAIQKREIPKYVISVDDLIEAERRRLAGQQPKKDGAKVAQSLGVADIHGQRSERPARRADRDPSQPDPALKTES